LMRMSRIEHVNLESGWVEVARVENDQGFIQMPVTEDDAPVNMITTEEEDLLNEAAESYMEFMELVRRKKRLVYLASLRAGIFKHI